MCPGRYLVDALLFSYYVHILAGFNVSCRQQLRRRRQLDALAKMKVESNGAA